MVLIYGDYGEMVSQLSVEERSRDRNPLVPQARKSTKNIRQMTDVFSLTENAYHAKVSAQLFENEKGPQNDELSDLYYNSFYGHPDSFPI